MSSYKIIERGDGFRGVERGAEVYDAEAGDLLVITSPPGSIHTDDPRGNYVVVECEAADRDVTTLTDAEFAALPQVLVVVRS